MNNSRHYQKYNKPLGNYFGFMYSKRKSIYENQTAGLFVNTQTLNNIIAAVNDLDLIKAAGIVNLPNLQIRVQSSYMVIRQVGGLFFC